MSLADFFVKLQAKSKQLKWLFYLALLFSVLIDFFIPRHHEAHHEMFWGEKIPAFWAILSFIGCILFIKICKGAAHTFLGKSEDYYD